MWEVKKVNNGAFFSELMALAKKHKIDLTEGIEVLNEADETKPYKEKIELNLGSAYNEKYKPNGNCVCGHPYDRHFDSYEDNLPVGCKYCTCGEFVEQEEGLSYHFDLIPMEKEAYGQLLFMGYEGKMAIKKEEKVIKEFIDWYYVKEEEYIKDFEKALEKIKTKGPKEITYKIKESTHIDAANVTPKVKILFEKHGAKER